MRFLLSFKLDNGTIMSLVTEAQNMSIAKNQAIQMSNSIFRDDTMHIKPTNSLIHSERWGKDKVMAYRPGNRNYNVAFMFNGQPQYITTDGSGYKSAYNNVVCKFALSNDTAMFIYEMNQRVVRKDAMVNARQVIKDGKALSELTRAVGRVMQSDSKLVCYMDNFRELIIILKEYKSRKYLNVSADKLVSLVAVMLFVADTSSYTLEAYGINDRVTAVTSILNNMSSDVQEYKIWLTDGEKDNIVIC